MANELLIGITGKGVVHTDADNFDIDTRFRMAREAGVFDYYDKSPLPGEMDAYLKASEKYGLGLANGTRSGMNRGWSRGSRSCAICCITMRIGPTAASARYRWR